MTDFKDTSGDDTLVGTTGNDSFNVTHGGNDTVSGLDGDDIVNFGATLTAADTIDGGAGKDRVILSGDYSSTLTLADTTMVNVEEIILRAGNSYRIATADGNVAAGQSMIVSGAALGASDTFTFNGGAETDGRLHIIGGAGNDRLIGGARSDVFDLSRGGEDSIQGYLGNDVIKLGATLDAGDAIRGGAGNDTVELSNVNVALGATTLLSVEKIDISGSGSLTLNAATIVTGTTMTFDHTSASTFDLDASAKVAGANIDVIGGTFVTMGGTLSAGDVVDSTTTTLNGDYSGPVPPSSTFTLDGTTLELLGGHIYDFNLTSSTLSSVDGSAASALNLTLGTNVAAVTGSAGNDDFTVSTYGGVIKGGDGDDHLLVTAAGTEEFDGGNGYDTLELNGANAGFNGSSGHLRNVELIVCDPGHSYGFGFDQTTINRNPNLTIDGHLLGANDSLTVVGPNGHSIHDVIGGAGDDELEIFGGTVTGGGGADWLLGGNTPNHGGDDFPAGVDQFVYNAVSDSTSTAYDSVQYFEPTEDSFKLWYQVTGVDATITGGNLSTATFDSDLAAAVGPGQLAAYHAVLFNPNGGSLSHDTFLVIDANGTAGYQAGQDLVIQLDLLETGTMTTANFTS